MDHSTFSRYCLSYLKGCLVNNLYNFWNNLIEISMWLYIRTGYGSQYCLQMMLETWKKPLIIKIKHLEHCWQIYLKQFFAGVMIYWLLTFMQFFWTYSPVPNCSWIKDHFWANFSIHFTLSFSTRVWVEKILLSFYGFRQISKTHPCYFFSPNSETR